MPIPDFQTLMLPLLRLAADGRTWTMAEAREELADEFRLSPEEREELLPSGRQRRFANRVAWAKVHLEQAGLLESPERGRFRITDRGRALLAEQPARVDMALLERYPEYVDFRRRSQRPADARAGAPAEGAVTAAAQLATPEELLDQAYQALRTELAAELLARLKTVPPPAFERIVVDLLVKMGYGGSHADAGKAIGRSGDEGIDGMVSEDRLGLDVIYVQAKRWEGTVGRPEVQRFVGALHGKQATKGVFITTGTFSADAREYVKHITPRVVLVDGRELAELMIDHGVGVSTKQVYEIRKVDSDYFSEL